jgi:hypothetical protein
MGLREKWTEARERDRQERGVQAASQRSYTKALELQKLGVPAMTTDGWPDPALTEEDLDAMLAAEKERRAELYKMFVRAGTVTTFRAIGVQIPAGGDKMYTIGNHDPWAKTNDSRLLGPLAGAKAMVTDGSQAWSPGRAMFLPLALTALATKTKADAAVVFLDGTVHTHALNNNTEVREAQKQVVQFNALAGSSSPADTETNNDQAARLQKILELREAGMLSQEEYDAKRAEIIASI